MHKFWTALLCVVMLWLCSGGWLQSAECATVVWSIGKADNNTAEFALAPANSNHYSAKFEHDALFIVGISQPNKDWSYIQPGPADAWAGGKSHTFTIVFGLKAKPAPGPAQLTMDLVDTHSVHPPKLRININGKIFERQLPRGAGDASAHGQPEKGREHIETIRFDTELLKQGNNTITITSATGSWILYDAVSLSLDTQVQLGDVQPETQLRQVKALPYLVADENDVLKQPVTAVVLHTGPPATAELFVDGAQAGSHRLSAGINAIEALIPAVETARTVKLKLRIASRLIAQRKVPVKPVRRWHLYILPHSHVDIGYTKVQTEVEKTHWKYFEQAIELAKKTADYPPDAQFKWNVEVLWAVDSYLRQGDENKRRQFIEAVKNGWIGLDALYANELTALCSQEELVHLLEFARQLRRDYGFQINSAMISDVPGYTWGIVPVLAQSGVRYFSIGPNRDARIGYTLQAWADRPFWWVSPCGRYKVLCWVAGQGYSWFLAQPGLKEKKFFDYLQQLETAGYPYDIVQVRYTIGSDNGPPDPALPEFVKRWNSKYAWPKLTIATTSQMFEQFERRYGQAVPARRGDFTPYWEDGAASSAYETALNRAAAERLVQAEALWAMFGLGKYPAEKFYSAWRNAVLYDEHTWGAYCSISEPDSPFTKAQWQIKQRFALDADAQSRQLLNDAIKLWGDSGEQVTAVDVFNTCSWPVTALVVIPSNRLAGRLVRDSQGNPIPAQQLTTEELAFVARDVPGFGAKRFTFQAGSPHSQGSARAEGNLLQTDQLTVRIDEQTGAITTLHWKRFDLELANDTDKTAINSFFYVRGADPNRAVTNGPVKIHVKEPGPLVASVVIESSAPGCNKLTREVRLVDGLEQVELIDVIDKQRVYKKEGVHIGFSFRIPDAQMRMDMPWAVVRPEADQLPGACKNWFTIQRWVDLSNQDFGVTWVTLDAPLVEVGAITAETPWIKHLQPSQSFYSYVMNNYWFTNYCAYQEGTTTFRYILGLHRQFDPAWANQFAISHSRPLLVIAVTKDRRPFEPMLRISPQSVIVSTLKPSSDRTSYIVRLFNTAARPERTHLQWRDGIRGQWWLSDLSERKIARISGTVELAAYEVLTLRFEPAIQGD